MNKVVHINIYFSKIKTVSDLNDKFVKKGIPQVIAITSLTNTNNHDPDFK